MKNKTKKQQEKCLMDEEMLMWTSYRYCIGRKTYVSSLASYIAKKYYPILSEQRMLFTAQDIRKEIEDHFNWNSINFKYDGTVYREDRKPYEDCIEFIMNEIVKDNDDTNIIQEKLLKIKSVEVYHDKYAIGEPHQYHITYRSEGDTRNYMYQGDFTDYQCWAALASVFDKQHYKKVHVNFNNEEKDIICFETWVEDTKPIPEQPGYHRMWPWHWKKVYVSVDDFIANGEHCCYIYEDYIISVEDYDAREDKTTNY